MAGKKITDMGALTASGVATGDLLTLVDVSEANATLKNKKITMDEARTYFNQVKEQIDGFIESPADKTYVLRLNAGYGLTIDSLKIKTVSGTCTAAVKIDTTAVTGISAVSVTSTEASASASAANTVAAGDTINLTLSSGSSPVDLSFSLFVTRS